MTKFTRAQQNAGRTVPSVFLSAALVSSLVAATRIPSDAQPVGDPSSSVAGAAIVPEVPMEETELKGSTATMGEIDPLAIPSAGPDCSGEVCNKMPNGVSIHALTFTIKKGTATSIQMKGQSSVVPFVDGTARVTLDRALGGNVRVGYKIRAMKGDGSGENLIFNVTPSVKANIDRADVELNALAPYHFDAKSPMIRNELAETHRPGVLAFVFNDHTTETLDAISGTITLPAGTKPTLTDVRLLRSDGVQVPSAQISITANTFSISGFGGLAPTKHCQVVMLLSPSLEGKTYRAQLTATFVP